MQTMTVKQLRTASMAGGVKEVILRAVGSDFLLEISMLSGALAVLSKARSESPRTFGNIQSAITMLRGIGIMNGSFDAADWKPTDKSGPINVARSESMTQAHRARAYFDELKADIESSQNDGRSHIRHSDVISGIKSRLSVGRG